MWVDSSLLAPTQQAVACQVNKGGICEEARCDFSMVSEASFFGEAMQIHLFLSLPHTGIFLIRFFAICFSGG